MSLLGKLAVAVVGDTSGLTSSLADAKKQVGAFNKDVQKSGVNLQNVGKVMAATGAAIVGTFTAITVKTASYADDMDKMAQKTGMGVEAVQKLGYAAKIAGDVEMDALGKALGKLAKTADDAAKGGKQSSASFKEIGVSVTDANGRLKGTDQLFLDIADKFSKMPDGIQKTSEAMSVFGKSGASLIPILNQGRDGIERLMQEAQDLGVVIDENSIKSLAAFDDNMKRIKASMGGLTMQIAAAVAPAFEKISAVIVGLMKWFNQLNPGMRQALTIIIAVAGAVGLLGGAFLMIVPQIYATATAMGALELSFAPFAIGAAVAVGLAAIVSKISDIAAEARNAKKDVEDLANAAEVASAKSGVTKDLLMTRDSIRRIMEDDAVSRNLAKNNGNDYQMDSRTKTELENLRRRENDLQKKLEAIDRRGKELNKPSVVQPKPTPAPKSGGFDLAKFLKETDDKLKAVDEREEVFGDVTDVAAEKAGILKGAIEQLLEKGYKPTDKALSGLIDKYQQFGESYIDTTDAIEQDNYEDEVQANIQKQTENQKAAVNALTEVQDRMDEISGKGYAEWEKFVAKLREFAKADGVAEETAQSLKKMADEYEGLMWMTKANTGHGYENPAFADLKEENMAVVEAAHEYLMQMADEETPAWENLAEQLEATAEKCPAISEDLYELAAKVREVGRAADETGDQIKNMQPGEAWEKAYEDYENNYSTFSEDMYDFSQNTLGAVEDGFEGVFESASHGFKNLGDVFKDFANTVTSMCSKMMAHQFMRYLMGNTSFGSWFGGLGADVGTGSSYSGANSGLSTGYTPGYWGQLAGTRASGGSVSAFSPYLVGENGPEVFVPGANGSIVSNDKLGGFAPTVQINNINQSGIPLQTEQKSIQINEDAIVVNCLTRAVVNNTAGARKLVRR